MDVVLERRLARRAATQSGLITRPQLVAIGLSRGQIARLLESGRLVTVTGDVYLIGGVPCGERIQLAAACLATGGVASHRSAAHLQGLVDLAPSRSEVTVGSTHGGRKGLLLHRSCDLLPRDIIRIDGIRTTNATRTLIDLGGVVPATTLETYCAAPPQRTGGFAAGTPFEFIVRAALFSVSPFSAEPHSEVGLGSTRRAVPSNATATDRTFWCSTTGHHCDSPGACSATTRGVSQSKSAMPENSVFANSRS
jgi:hypothetical protein